ncbi:hypothetical protein CNR22_16260 [Sphingobacteriaceae bacterium]|nr:hypothetical protein CNR22_16260 [Sphingobacteriaceae bacterium]
MKYKLFLLLFSFSIFTPFFTFAQSTATLCSGSQLCISGYSTGIWDGPGISSQTATCINPVVTGSYSCQTIDLFGAFGPVLTYSITVADKPVVTFSTNAPALCGSSYTFNGNASVSSGSLISQTWNFGDGNSSLSFPSTTYNYSAPGTYSVALVAESSEGCIDSAVHILTVSPIPALSFDFSPICLNTSTTFTNTSTIPAPGSITSYHWDFGNASNSALVNPSATFTSAGIYSITLTATAASGCTVGTVETVTVYASPAISFSTTNLCSRKLIAFTPYVSVASGSITNYSWLLSSSSSTLYASTSSSPSFTFAPGNYQVVLTLTTEYGCSSTNTQTISVAPTPTVSFTAQALNVCSTAFSFSYTGTGQSSYSWNYDGLTTGTSTETSFTYPSSGTYTASAIGISSTGCSDTLDQSFTIYPAPSLNFTLANTCLNTTFSISSSPSASISSRTWDFGDPASGAANTSTLSSPSHSYGSAATYTLLLTLTNNVSCTSQTTIPVTINPNPFITVSSGSICTGQSFSLNASGAATYTYLTGSAVVTPTANSTYSVKGTSAFGCIGTNTAVSSVTVYSLPTISVSNATICTGSAFTFTGIGAAQYSSGSGITSVSPTVTTTYTVSGLSSQGCPSSNTTSMTLAVNPVPTISVNSGTICSGTSFTIIPVSTSAYSISGGSSVVSPVTTTNYFATATNSLGCSASVPSNVSVLQPPTISVNSGSICSGSVFTLSPAGAVSYTYSGVTNTVAPNANTTYSVSGTGVTGCTNSAVSSVTVYITPTVSVNSGSICSGKSFTLMPTGASSYSFWSGSPVVNPASSSQFSVTGISAFGCYNTAISQVTVFITPTITVNSGTLCQGTNFTLAPAGTNSYNFSGGTAVVSPTSNATYTVTGISAEGCTATALSYITVFVSPLISVNSGSICEGSSFTMSPSGASTYTFSNGASVVTPASTTSYTITGTNTLGCTNTNNAVSTVTVKTIPVIQTLSTNTAMCVGETATLLATGALSYTWAGYTPAAYIFITPNVTTVYTVTGSNNTGCFKTEVYTQNVFTCAGINETKESASILAIYPNPNNGNFSIKSNSEIDLKLINALGQTVRLISVNASSDYKVDIRELAEGLYYISSQDGQRLFKQKIIVSR